jgi:nitrogen regulatory protein PII
MHNYICFSVCDNFGIGLGIFTWRFRGADAKALCASPWRYRVSKQHFQPPAGCFRRYFINDIHKQRIVWGIRRVLYNVSQHYLTGVHKKSVFEDAKESFGRKVVAILSGYKIGLSKLEHGHMYPLEDVEVTEDGTKKRKLLVFPKDEEREDIVARIKKNIKEQSLDENVWVTPGLPLLIFVTLGLIVALTYGDVVWIILSLILK